MKLTNFKTIALMLSASVLVALSGCGSDGIPSYSGFGVTPPVDTLSDETPPTERSVEVIISPDNLTAEFENAKIIFSENDIVKPETLIITAKTVESLGEDIELEQELDSEFKIDYKMIIYDFSISKEDDFIDTINIIISYDENMIDDSANEKDSVVAMYYNSENNQYESELFTVDTEKNEVNITTTHLSPHGIVIGDRTTHGPFYVDTSREYTRSAKITAVSAYSEYILSSVDQEVDVLNELFENDMTPGTEALEAGFSTSSAWLGLVSSGNTIVGAVSSAGGAGYSAEFLTTLSNAFTHVGLGASVLQLGIDFENGDEEALYTNLLKNTIYNTISYAGTSALQLAFSGVFFIDYALNAFAVEAFTLDAEAWKATYDLCYARYYSKSNVEWYKAFYWLSKDLNNPSNLGELIETTVYNNAYSVWENTDRLAECRSDAGYNNFPVLSEELKNEISLNKKAELLNSFSPVFNRLGLQMRIDNAESFERNLEPLKNMLNQVISLTIETPVVNNVAQYAGYTVKFASLNEYAKQDDWERIIPEDGTVNIKFRLLGYMEVGSPAYIEIYDTDNTRVEKLELGTISSNMVLTVDTEYTLFRADHASCNITDHLAEAGDKFKREGNLFIGASGVWDGVVFGTFVPSDGSLGDNVDEMFDNNVDYSGELADGPKYEPIYGKYIEGDVFVDGGTYTNLTVMKVELTYPDYSLPCTGTWYIATSLSFE